MKPLEFDPQRAAIHMVAFGYHHVSRDTNRAVLEEFAKNNGLTLQDDQVQFTYTLVRGGSSTGGRSPEEWEMIRKAEQDRKLKAAAAKKRRQP